MSYRNFKYSVPPFLAPTIDSVTGEQADWPSRYALLDEAPRRPFKTLVTTADQDLVLKFDAITSVGVILINRTNYPSVQIAKSDNGSSYTGITPDGWASTAEGLTIPIDPDVGRRKLLIDTTGLFNNLYLRFRMVAGMTTDDGVSYYRTGGITLGATLSMMPHNLIFPFTVTFPHPATTREFPSGGKQVNQLGDRRASIDVGGVNVDEDARVHAQAIAGAGLRPIIFWPNVPAGGQSSTSFDPSQAYLARQTLDPSRNYDVLPELYNQSLHFDEVV